MIAMNVVFPVSVSVGPKSAVRPPVTGVMEMVWVALALTPFVSVTVTVTMKLSLEVYVWLTGLPVPVVLSPKSQLKLYGLVPPVAVALNDTGPPTVPVVGPLMVTASASGDIVTEADAVAVSELVSVTVKVTVKVPLAV